MDIVEPIIAADISRDAESLTSFTWEQNSAATKNETGMMALLKAIHFLLILAISLCSS